VKGQSPPFAFQYDTNKTKCLFFNLYLPVSQIHNISKYGYRRAKQFGEEGGREESAQMFKTKKYFQKKFFTKIFPFSYRIIVDVKKGLHFQVYRNSF